MNITEAIALLAEAEQDAFEDLTPQYIAALRLGIEALKRLGEPRKLGGINCRQLLPGETE